LVTKLIIADSAPQQTANYPPTTLAVPLTRTTDSAFACRACVRNMANIARHTPYAARTPAASAPNTAHTNITESLTVKTLFFRLFHT
jgi:hypothetical protein